MQGQNESENKTEKILPTSIPNESENKAENTLPILIPTPLPTQTIMVEPIIDSTVGIEQCRAYTKEKRMVEEKRLNEIYAQSEPAIVELANTQNNGQTEAVALKYGYMTEQDIVRAADVFMELVNEGYPIETAQSMAESELSTYSAYLRSLHDWGVNEFKIGNATLKGILDTYENQVYQSCLSSL